MTREPDSSRTVFVWRVALGALFLLGWEWASRAGALDPFFFSRPSDVALRVWRWTSSGAIWPHLLTTFLEAALSFAIGGLFGVVSGFALARAPFLAAVLDPYIRIGNALPRVVLAPIFLLWFGLGIWSKVALASPSFSSSCSSTRFVVCVRSIA